MGLIIVIVVIVRRFEYIGDMGIEAVIDTGLQPQGCLGLEKTVDLDESRLIVKIERRLIAVVPGFQKIACLQQCLR